jgi:hypothetical protein
MKAITFVSIGLIFRNPTHGIVNFFININSLKT